MLSKILIVVVALATMSFATDGGRKKERATFTVYGECGMCEKRIEDALSDVKGVDWADWEQATLELTVRYNPKVISLDDIKRKVAAVGHDTEEFTATTEAYEKLHACCKYERPKK